MKSRRLLVGIIAIVGCVMMATRESEIHNGEPIVAAELAEQLVTSVGAQYEDARARALALDAAEWELLVADLLAAGPESLESIVAAALRVRWTMPEAAAEFDSRVTEVRENPQPDIALRPVYQSWVRGHDRNLSPLVFEAILLLDLPEAMVLSGLHELSLSGPNAEAIEPLLYIIAKHPSESTKHWAVAALWKVAKGSVHERIVPELIRRYEEYRTSPEFDWSERGVILPLCRVFTALKLRESMQALEAMYLLSSFEEAHMRAEGLSPWHQNADIKQELSNAQREQARLQRESHRKDLSERRRVVLADRLNALNSEISELEKQRAVKFLWDHLADAREKLESQLLEQER